MTNRLKYSLLILLSALLTFCVGFFAVQSFSAKAEEVVDKDNYTKYNLTEPTGNWGFTPDATIEYAKDFSQDNMILGFELQSLALKYDNLLKVQSDKWDQHGAAGSKQMLMNDNFIFTFIIYRGNNDSSTATELAKISVVMKYTDTNLGVLLDKHIYIQELVPRLEEEIFVPGLDYVYANNSDYKNDGILASGVIKEGNLFDPGEYKGKICIITPSASAKYFIRFNYDFYVNNKDRKLYKDQDHDKNYDHFSPENPADSNARSVMDVLKSLNDTGKLNETFSGDALTYANNLLTNTEVKAVTVRYLKDIPGTPFAQKYQSVIAVPVTNDQINPIDVSVALNVENLNAIGGNSPAGWFEKDVNGFYDVHYLPSVWVRSYTAGDQYLDSQVNTNLSYQEYYQRYIEDGIITQDIYEFQWAQLIKAYPALSGYLPNQVYGFYGLVMIPDHIDLNSLWIDAFGVETKKSGMITFAESKYNFSDYEKALSNYYKLMDKYEYGWLKSFEATFNAAFLDGKLDAKVYLYACDGRDSRVFISEGGGENGGGINEDLGGLNGKIKDWFKKTGETVADLGIQIGTNKTALIIIAIVVVAVIIFFKAGIFSALINGKFRRRK